MPYYVHSRQPLPAAAYRNRTGFLLISIHKTCTFSCWIKRVCPPCDTLILPASRSGKYNTLHLCSKGCVPKGAAAPFGNPSGFLRNAHPHRYSVRLHFSKIRTINRSYAPCKSCIAPFIVSSPFLGLLVVPCKLT